MRAALLLILVLGTLHAFPQAVPAVDARPLVITDAVALPKSSAQVLQIALKCWTYSFGQEPGARILQVDTADGSIKAVARFNFRSSNLGSREESMGVINYDILVQAENGQCTVRIGHFTHTGNRNTPNGGVDLGLLYADRRPQIKVAGISMTTANRLHDDMGSQVQARLASVVKNFFGALRRASAADQ